MLRIISKHFSGHQIFSSFVAQFWGFLFSIWRSPRRSKSFFEIPQPLSITLILFSWVSILTAMAVASECKEFKSLKNKNWSSWRLKLQKRFFEWEKSRKVSPIPIASFLRTQVFCILPFIKKCFEIFKISNTAIETQKSVALTTRQHGLVRYVLVLLLGFDFYFEPQRTRVNNTVAETSVCVFLFNVTQQCKRGTKWKERRRTDKRHSSFFSYIENAILRITPKI